MSRKNKFKLVTLAMLLALLPSMNLETAYHIFQEGYVAQTSLSKVLSPQAVNATTSKQQPLLKTTAPMNRTFSGQTATNLADRLSLKIQLSMRWHLMLLFGNQVSTA